MPASSPELAGETGELGVKCIIEAVTSPIATRLNPDQARGKPNFDLEKSKMSARIVRTMQAALDASRSGTSNGKK